MPRRSHIDQMCAICGIRLATTRDHTPPKSVFPPPRPTNLVTVPACSECNNGSAEIDEYFRAYLSIHVGTETPITEKLWAKHALPRIRRRPKLLKEIVSGMKPIMLPTDQGQFVPGYQGIWNSNAHDAVIERIIRGLYFHHFSEILGNKVRVSTQWLQTLNHSLVEEARQWKLSSIGKQQFVYRYARASDGPLHSVWLFQFHQRHWASGYTTPIEECNKPF